MNVAARYAKALLETCRARKISQAELEQVEAGLVTFAESLSASRSLRVALQSPITTHQEKENVLTALVNNGAYPAIVQNFTRLLVRNQRCDLLRSVLFEFKALRATEAGRIIGIVEGADPLTEEQIERLTVQLNAVAKQSVTLVFNRRPELIAGLRVSLSGVTYDGSVRGQIERLKREFDLAAEQLGQTG